MGTRFSNKIALTATASTSLSVDFRAWASNQAKSCVNNDGNYCVQYEYNELPLRTRANRDAQLDLRENLMVLESLGRLSSDQYLMLRVDEDGSYETMGDWFPNPFFSRLGQQDGFELNDFTVGHHIIFNSDMANLAQIINIYNDRTGTVLTAQYLNSDDNDVEIHVEGENIMHWNPSAELKPFTCYVGNTTPLTAVPGHLPKTHYKYPFEFRGHFMAVNEAHALHLRHVELKKLSELESITD